MSGNYPKNVKKSVLELVNAKIISPESGKRYSQGPDREVSAPSLDDVAYDPVFTCIVIDKSGSMNTCVDGVISGQHAMLDALRGSAITRNGAHFVLQYLFDNGIRRLHGPEKLSDRQNADNVALLTPDLYRPGGMTALYKTLHMTLQDLLVLLSEARNQGASAKFSIVLISDGADTEGGVDPADIRRLIKELREKKLLKSSVVVGLLNSNFTRDNLENLRETVGFEEALDCNQASPREIREKFVMASQSTVARAQK